MGITKEEAEEKVEKEEKCEVDYQWPFVYVGKNWLADQDDDEQYIRRKQVKDEHDFLRCSTESEAHLSDKGFFCKICAPLYYICAAIGLVCQWVWCCCGYMLPNCVCVWRWPCFQGPDGCCGRAYVELEDIIEEMKTGDILVFCGDNATRFAAQSH